MWHWYEDNLSTRLRKQSPSVFFGTRAEMHRQRGLYYDQSCILIHYNVYPPLGYKKSLLMLHLLPVSLVTTGIEGLGYNLLLEGAMRSVGEAKQARQTKNIYLCL